MTQLKLKTHINLQEYDRYGDPIIYTVPLHGSNNGIFWDSQINATVAEITAALQEKRERDTPKPLTLEQLQQMDGQPVYCPAWGWGVVLQTVRNKNKTVIVFARCWKVAQNILPDGVYLNKPKEKEAQNNES